MEIQKLRFAFITFVITTGFFLASASTLTRKGQDEYIQEGEKPLTLRYLGNIAGKSLFAEANLTMNWSSAKAFCEASDLKLVSIETAAEANFIFNVLQRDYLRIPFWTSAREQRTHEGFVWDYTGEVPNVTILNNWYPHSPSYSYHYCGLVYFNSAQDHGMSSQHLCSSSSFRVMCQS